MSHFAIKISKKKARKHRHSVFSLYISGLEKNQSKVEERDSAQESVVARWRRGILHTDFLAKNSGEESCARNQS